MSSLYVRNLVRGWAATSSTPYYDTINYEQNPNDPVWWTIQFEVEGSDVLTVCGDEEESGMIGLIFCGQPGAGDGAVLAAAEAEGKRMMRHADPAGRLTLIRAMPPEEFSAGDGDRWYRCVISCEYQYYP